MSVRNTSPRVSIDPQAADCAFLRGEVELVGLPDAEGRIAAEGPLPYPPGVLCVVARGSTGWCCSGLLQRFWKKASTCSGFAAELQVVCVEEHDGRSKLGAMPSSLSDAQSALLKGEKFVESG
ncbi:hypothetical protein ACNKHN_03385 [Shigella flexneri]